MVEELVRVICQCGDAPCFWEEDLASLAKNSKLASCLGQNDIAKERGLFLQLETERLQKKSEWMDSLQVQGSFQVRCSRLVEGVHS